MDTPEKYEYTLLHVEDSPELQELVRHIQASRPSIRIIGGATVNEGVALARQHCPDLILMDIHLPDGSGIDAMKKLQDSKETSEIPVVALSSLASQMQIEQGLKQGFKYYITKPIDIPEMLETIDRILDSTLKR